MFTWVMAFSLALGVLAGGPGSGRVVPADNRPIDQAGGGKVCPAIYAPVICDNGKTYSNQCEADRHHAQNCVPTGDL